MTITLDRKTYGSLLEQYQPKVITSEEEYNLAIESIEKLMECGEELSLEENSLLELLSILVEIYEDSQFSLESASPQEILLHLMDARGLKQADLVEVIGSKGVISEIVNGKRSISKAQAKALGDFFNVSAALFI
ncbi:helix-turn-helix domain-containing protein [Anabaena sphaerica FACHB-251]|uniref:Helix-turn-helix domain-containing protein n=1 Tax=Anabaena sphaerica FACHB-251 TaxID=2692883 RepID=A0A926ZZN9_9NOST|nr:helix-turn-helix domain-containing protein [Anabaena sphaerica]MBD2292628.1 helix-turn-helix domain-containing protein [Anabaena sphaerica FACHB-251]